MNVKLNGQQMLVLQWIAAGAEEATAPVPTYKTSALALQNRGLASGSRRGGTWKASLTDDGAYFLKHGRRPRNQVRSPPPVPHRRRASSPEAAPDPPLAGLPSATRSQPLPPRLRSAHRLPKSRFLSRRASESRIQPSGRSSTTRHDFQCQQISSNAHCVSFMPWSQNRCVEDGPSAQTHPLFGKISGMDDDTKSHQGQIFSGSTQDTSARPSDFA